ncbi:MAG: GNAT family N-acetyltransferase [Siphonobacter sp.]
MEIYYTLAESDEDIRQIRNLMQANLKTKVTSEEAKDQGFVTIPYELATLQRMNEVGKHVIAKRGDQVVAYALTAFKTILPEIDMFAGLVENIHQVSYAGKPLSESNYYVMGQICVSKECRGMGVFDGLYAHHRKVYGSQFDYLVTDISIHNTRSLAAHQRVGFEVIATFVDNTDTWKLVVLDL